MVSPRPATDLFCRGAYRNLQKTCPDADVPVPGPASGGEGPDAGVATGGAAANTVADMRRFPYL